ncbi:MAG TPA: hypothetical protein PK147_05820 [Saprospiraceae bacterium]|nr:hypothetical protein [Saprospiraceae bacterium]
MDKCILELDFDGAKVFRDSWIYSVQKLNTLKSLEDPNYKKKSRLRGIVENGNIKLQSVGSEMRLLDDELRKNMEQHWIEVSRKRIIQAEKELEELESKSKTKWVDDDKIIQILERLLCHDIKLVEFEIVRNKIYLKLEVVGDEIEFRFLNSNDVKLENYLVNDSKSTLHILGYDNIDYSKKVMKIEMASKFKILEELAIIYFEVFGVFNEALNLKIVI